MQKRFENWMARLKRWETFFHQFIDYIFHTQAGRRIRWQFLRETLLRTITYTMAGVVGVVILWCYHLFHGDSPAVNVTLAVLILDFAFGAAFLRTMNTYRHRVQTFLRWDDEHDQPVVQNEAERDLVATKIDKMDDLEIAGGGNQNAGVESDNADIAPDPAEPAIARQLFKCKSCGRRITMPVEGPMFDLQCSCGGKMRAV